MPTSACYSKQLAKEVFQRVLHVNTLLRRDAQQNAREICSGHVMLHGALANHKVPVLKVDFLQREIHTARPALIKKIASSSLDLSKNSTMVHAIRSTVVRSSSQLVLLQSMTHGAVSMKDQRHMYACDARKAPPAEGRSSTCKQVICVGAMVTMRGAQPEGVHLAVIPRLSNNELPTVLCLSSLDKGR